MDEKEGGNLLFELERDLQAQIGAERAKDAEADPDQEGDALNSNEIDGRVAPPLGAPENCEDFFFLVRMLFQVSLPFR